MKTEDGRDTALQSDDLVIFDKWRLTVSVLRGGREELRFGTAHQFILPKSDVSNFVDIMLLISELTGLKFKRVIFTNSSLVGFRLL